MKSYPESYLHELSTHEIINAIENGKWDTSAQSIQSAETNNNDLIMPDDALLLDEENTAGINAFFDIDWKGVKQILDIGGGQFDSSANYLKKSRNIELLVWDPYNRTPEHNQGVKAKALQMKFDAVTSMSVLNVIPEVIARIAHIATVWEGLKKGKNAYFKIWSGEGFFKRSYLPTVDESGYQANALADRFFWEITLIFGISNVRIDRKIPNLIIANKTSNIIKYNEIEKIKEQSHKESPLFQKRKEHTYKEIAYKLTHTALANELKFFKRVADDFLYANRNNDKQSRDLFDKKYGLTLSMP